MTTESDPTVEDARAFLAELRKRYEDELVVEIVGALREDGWQIKGVHTRHSEACADWIESRFLTDGRVRLVPAGSRAGKAPFHVDELRGHGESSDASKRTKTLMREKDSEMGRGA